MLAPMRHLLRAKEVVLWVQPGGAAVDISGSGSDFSRQIVMTIRAGANAPSPRAPIPKAATWQGWWRGEVDRQPGKLKRLAALPIT